MAKDGTRVCEVSGYETAKCKHCNGVPLSTTIPYASSAEGKVYASTSDKSGSASCARGLRCVNTRGGEHTARIAIQLVKEESNLSMLTRESTVSNPREEGSEAKEHSFGRSRNKEVTYYMKPEMVYDY